MKGLIRAYKVFIAVFAVIVVAAVVIGTKGLNEQENHIYVLPVGYTGWVTVIYNQKDYPELPKEGDAIVNNIPKDGVLKTSSAPTGGGMTFYYADDQGNRTEVGIGMVQGQHMGTDTIQRPDGTNEEKSINAFYVGTEQQYNDHLKDQP
ncbi:hypothetical protein [Paenibacillus sp. XY044]|uniref:DUF6843 domain-containing protein n=1 Tax=Paenibacillus sp. XY044 TaxID=2026089 RepID=UPI0015C5B8CF|nr:hypothetical protein [Paenibacillus sp. XY044]